MVSWFWQSCQGNAIVFSINDAGTTGYPFAKKKKRTYILTSHHMQKLTQNES